MTKNWKSKTFSIAEWYGCDFLSLEPGEIQEMARLGSPKSMGCPFSPGPCSKKGGVCSIRTYGENDDEKWMPADRDLVATCPRRFQDADMIVRWIGETLIAEKNPKVVVEVPFLEGIAHNGGPTGSTVGKIDMVLATEKRNPFDWCAVEIQSVYFSGSSMGREFVYLKDWDKPVMPPPQGRRHPDFRSSGPKRLMPQLQTKVPTISRWGHKMAVVIDRPFWRSLSPMEEVDDVSNCDVAWFVVRFERGEERFEIAEDGVHFTTLARAVEGLTAGKPVPLSKFEHEITAKLSR